MPEHSTTNRIPPATSADIDRESLLRDHSELDRRYWRDLDLSRRAMNTLIRIVPAQASVLEAILVWNRFSDRQRHNLRGCGPVTVSEIDRMFQSLVRREK